MSTTIEDSVKQLVEIREKIDRLREEIERLELQRYRIAAVLDPSGRIYRWSAS